VIASPLSTASTFDARKAATAAPLNRFLKAMIYIFVLPQFLYSLSKTTRREKGRRKRGNEIYKRRSPKPAIEAQRYSDHDFTALSSLTQSKKPFPFPTAGLDMHVISHLLRPNLLS
jgi:hypothetical protein